jgi:hypothetical protein
MLAMWVFLPELELQALPGATSAHQPSSMVRPWCLPKLNRYGPVLCVDLGARARCFLGEGLHLLLTSSSRELSAALRLFMTIVGSVCLVRSGSKDVSLAGPQSYEGATVIVLDVVPNNTRTL